jgi:hypothetical protein
MPVEAETTGTATVPVVSASTNSLITSGESDSSGVFGSRCGSGVGADPGVTSAVGADAGFTSGLVRLYLAFGFLQR